MTKKTTQSKAAKSRDRATVYRALRKTGGPLDHVLQKLAHRRSTVSERDVLSVLPIVLFSGFLITLASGGVGYFLGNQDAAAPKIDVPLAGAGQYAWWSQYIEQATPAPAESNPMAVAADERPIAQVATTQPMVKSDAPQAATDQSKPAANMALLTEAATQAPEAATAPKAQTESTPVAAPVVDPKPQGSAFQVTQVKFKSTRAGGEFNFALTVTGDKPISGTVWAVAHVRDAKGVRFQVAPAIAGAEQNPLTYSARRFTEKQIKFNLAKGQAIERVVLTVQPQDAEAPTRKGYRIRSAKRAATVATSK